MLVLFTLAALLFAATIVFVALAVMQFSNSRNNGSNNNIPRIIIGPTGPAGTPGQNGATGLNGATGPAGGTGGSGVGATGLIDVEMLNVTPGSSFGPADGAPAATVVLAGLGLFDSSKAQYIVGQTGLYTATFSDMSVNTPTAGVAITESIQFNAVTVATQTVNSVGTITPIANLPTLIYTGPLVPGDTINFLVSQNSGSAVSVATTTTMLTVSGAYT